MEQSELKSCYFCNEFKKKLHYQLNKRYDYDFRKITKCN